MIIIYGNFMDTLRMEYVKFPGIKYIDVELIEYLVSLSQLYDPNIQHTIYT